MDFEIQSGKTVNKQIYNPVTGKYYPVCQHSGKYCGPGQITGPWSPKNKSK
jgi:hypothetical protein